MTGLRAQAWSKLLINKIQVKIGGIEHLLSSWKVSQTINIKLQRYNKWTTLESFYCNNIILVKYYTTKLNKKEKQQQQIKFKLDVSWILHLSDRQQSDSESLISEKKVISLICFWFYLFMLFPSCSSCLGRWNQQTALQVNIAWHHEQKINTNHQSN